MSDVTEQFLGPFAGHVEPTEAERLDNLEAAARDMASIAGIGFSSPSGLDGGRRLRSGRTYGSAAREVPADAPSMPADLFVETGLFSLRLALLLLRDLPVSRMIRL